ncbi:MAG TPA: alkaline shock response membrane anchor protein AmaP [Clostridia bacterium]|nr:alkaline shock response membrane anchor protein AmaP [Clostridia bacterium]
MNRWIRTILIVFSFVLAVLFLIALLMIASTDILTGMITMMLDMTQKQPAKTIAIVVSLVGLLVAVMTLIMSVMSGRLRKTRIRANEIGDIEIGVEAIENIALNAAKTSQSGVKTAKARVAPAKGGKLFVRLVIQAFSDVELPIMMTRVQERVKKDIEKYTGIEVSNVEVRISRVEDIAPRVER